MMRRATFTIAVVCVFVIASFGPLRAQEKEGASKEKGAKTQKTDKGKPAPQKKAGKASEKPKLARKKAAAKPKDAKPKAAKPKQAAPIKEVVKEVKQPKVLKKPLGFRRAEVRAPQREASEERARAEKRERAEYESLLSELTDIVAKHERERIAESEKRIEEVKERLGKHLKLIQQRHAEKEEEYLRTIKEFREDLLDLNRRVEQLIKKYTPTVEERPKPKRSDAPPPEMKERDIAAAKEELYKAGMEYYFRAADVYIPIKPFIETFFDEKGVSISVYNSKYKEEATAQVNLSYDENHRIVGLVSKGEDFARGEWREIPPREEK